MLIGSTAKGTRERESHTKRERERGYTHRYTSIHIDTANIPSNGKSTLRQIDSYLKYDRPMSFDFLTELARRSRNDREEEEEDRSFSLCSSYVVLVVVVVVARARARSRYFTRIDSGNETLLSILESPLRTHRGFVFLPPLLLSMIEIVIRSFGLRRDWYYTSSIIYIYSIIIVV